MKPSEVKEYFVTGYRFQLATGMTANSFDNWMKWGYIPMHSQCRLEEFTNGKLKANFQHVRRHE